MWNVIEAVLVAFACAAASKFYLHMYQLESYQADGYLRWLNRNRDRLLGATLGVGVIFTFAAILLPIVCNMFSRKYGEIIGNVITLIAFMIAALNVYFSQYATPQKKPLVFTGRMKRLAVCLCAITLAVAYLLTLINAPAYLLFCAVPYIAYVSGLAIEPYEKRVNAKFFNMAKAKLASMPDLIKIGVTGSFGKTSTKFALQTILSEKYKVYASPGSTNTPMGLSRVINENLDATYNAFIAEMGARHTNDIRELCELVHPKYGAITSIGPAHLETFGSISAIGAAKFELIESLPGDGCAFFGAGGEIDSLYKRCAMKKVSAGINAGDVRATSVETGPFGSRFTLTRGGEKIRCETQLLGVHNIKNIALAAAVALEMGLGMDEVARGIRKIKPVEHRLQLIRGPVTVIDDAFNSNPEGAREALSVLTGFLGQRIIVTPGMVEMGEDEDEYNSEFGREIASACDACILVGERHTRPIAEGLIRAGFDKRKLFVVSSLDEAQGKIKEITKPGDVVLFENDLPDNYS